MGHNAAAAPLTRLLNARTRYVARLLQERKLSRRQIADQVFVTPGAVSAVAIRHDLPGRTIQPDYDYDAVDWTWCNRCIGAQIGAVGYCTVSDARRNHGSQPAPKRGACPRGAECLRARTRCGPEWALWVDWHTCNVCVAREGAVAYVTAVKRRAAARRGVRPLPFDVPRSPAVCPGCGRKAGIRVTVC